MSCGATVIGADSPGIREIINHGKNGWLCGTGSESIRAAIIHLLNNPGLCSKLGKNARKYALEHFALDRILKMEEKVLKSVMDENSMGQVK
jgi:glycosyltransferase involved in cell wall biosynthesis